MNETLENLKKIDGAPSVQMAEIPPDLYFAYNQFSDDKAIDEANDIELRRIYDDKHVVHEAELFDGEKDQEHDHKENSTHDNNS